ncbi:hypothetical protein BIW11_13233 [Tropilaelaps mercedesae]|uniref:CBS domain-containing protein n=1 Tax=Tropilaelaps mercedesae TaxID=418985 RepID=A0A1V9X341_9ACAR|nr:hypothetical protein BIW11_13233 [Tropilaelaps mercedesae]
MENRRLPFKDKDSAVLFLGGTLSTQTDGEAAVLTESRKDITYRTPPSFTGHTRIPQSSQEEVTMHRCQARPAISYNIQLALPHKPLGEVVVIDYPGIEYNEASIDPAKNARLASSDTSICDRIDIEDLGADEAMLFVKFFRYYHCYDLIPLSAKLVVFDTQLLVKKAFFALVSNGVRAAPLWDSAQQDFVGMLTITDFIHILRKYHGSPTVRMDELEEHKIDTWRTVLTEMQRPLVSIGPDASLCDAITALIQQRVHRLPVIDKQTGNVLYVLTHKRILRFLFLYFYDLPHASYLDQSIQDLKVGSFENIATCKPTMPLIEALNTFIERRVSALPVVDEDGKVVDIYAKFDVINLAAEKTYNNLDISVGAALEFRNQYFEGVMTCRSTDSLLQVMAKIVRAEVHRLVIVDDEEHVVGIVSLSDILTFLVLKPLDIERPTSRSYGVYVRTTSTERENGTLAEEPELEAKASAHGEGAVANERLKHSNSSTDDVDTSDQAKEKQDAPSAGEESTGKGITTEEDKIVESSQSDPLQSTDDVQGCSADQSELGNMSAEGANDSKKAVEQQQQQHEPALDKSVSSPSDDTVATYTPAKDSVDTTVSGGPARVRSSCTGIHPRIWIHRSPVMESKQPFGPKREAAKSSRSAAESIRFGNGRR